MKSMSLKAVIAAIFCNLLFGSAFPMIKLGYEYFSISEDVFSKILYAGIRFFISGIAVAAFAFATKKKFPTVSKKNSLRVFALALTYTFLQYIFFYVGLSNTSGAVGSIVNSSSVFMAVIAAHFIYKDDKLDAKKSLGSLIGFIGVTVACFAKGGFDSFSLSGEGFVLLASLFYVIGSIVNKSSAQIDGSLTVSVYNLLIGGALLIAVGILGHGKIAVTPLGVLILLYLVCVSAIGFTLWSSLLKKYPIGKLSVYSFIIPVSGSVLSAVFLGESILSWRYIIALLLVAAGIIIVNHGKAK